jgi:precorrin-6A/cobalt-precorrin-6A reductase
VILVLGGTTEGRELAGALEGVVSSLAGRVSTPQLPPGEVRIGGFGGVAGLVAWIQERRPQAVIDATHPFAAQMSRHAVAACASTGTPLLRLQRRGWTEQAGDRWVRVATAADAARVLPALGTRVLLTTGRLELAAFADLTMPVVLRSVEPPQPPVPAQLVTLTARGPWTLEQERELLTEHRIDVLVTKDSGGPTAPKLTAARLAGIPVVMIDRPPVAAVEQVGTVAEALRWGPLTGA